MRGSGCLDHCKGPTVRLEAHGKKRTYGKVRSESEREALVEFIQTGKEKKVLKKLRV